MADGGGAGAAARRARAWARLVAARAAEALKRRPVLAAAALVLAAAACTWLAAVADGGASASRRAAAARAWELCTAERQRAWLDSRYACDYQPASAADGAIGEPNAAAVRAVAAWHAAGAGRDAAARCAVLVVGGIKPGAWMDALGILRLAPCHILLLPPAGRNSDAATAEIESRRAAANRADHTAPTHPADRTHALPVPRNASLSEFVGSAIDATKSTDTLVLLPYRLASASALKALGGALRSRSEVSAVALAWAGAERDGDGSPPQGGLPKDSLAFAVTYFDSLSFDTVAIPKDIRRAPALQLSGVPGGATVMGDGRTGGALAQPLASSQPSMELLLVAVRRASRFLDHLVQNDMACAFPDHGGKSCACRTLPLGSCGVDEGESASKAAPSAPGARFHSDVNYVRGAQALRTGRRGGASSSDAIRRHREAIERKRQLARGTFMQDEFEDANTHAWREARSSFDRAQAEAELKHHNMAMDEHARDAESAARKDRLTELTRTRIMNLTRWAAIEARVDKAAMNDQVAQRMAELYDSGSRLDAREVPMDLDADDALMRDVVERQEREHALTAYENSEHEMLDLLNGNMSSRGNATAEDATPSAPPQSALAFAYNAVRGAAGRFFDRVGKDAHKPGAETLEALVPPSPAGGVAPYQKVHRHPLDPFATTRQGLVTDPEDGATVIPWGTFVRRCMNTPRILMSPHVLFVGTEVFRALYSDIAMAAQDGYNDYYEPAHNYFELSMVRATGNRTARRKYGESVSRDTWKCGPVGKERGVLDGDVEEDDLVSLRDGLDHARDGRDRRRFSNSGWDANPILNLADDAPHSRYDEACAQRPCRLQELRSFDVPATKASGYNGDGFSLTFLGAARPRCRALPDLLRRVEGVTAENRHVGAVMVSNPGLWACANGAEETWSRESGESDFRIATDLGAMIQDIENEYPKARKVWVGRTWTTNAALARCLEYVDKVAAKVLPETWERADVGTSLEGRCDLLTEDGIHLNAMGVRVVADAVLGGLCVDPLRKDKPVLPPPMPPIKRFGGMEAMHALCERKRLEGFAERMVGLGMMLDGPGSETTFKERQAMRKEARLAAIKNRTDEWVGTAVRERFKNSAAVDVLKRDAEEVRSDEDPLTMVEQRVNASYLRAEGGGDVVEGLIATLGANISDFAVNATRNETERAAGMSAREKLEATARAYDRERKAAAAARGGGGGWFGSNAEHPSDTSKSLEAYEAGKSRAAMRERMLVNSSSEDEGADPLPASAGDETLAPYTSTGLGTDVVGDGFDGRGRDAVTAAATAAREHPIRSVYTNAPPAAPAPRKARKKQKGARKKARGLLWSK